MKKLLRVWSLLLLICVLCGCSHTLTDGSDQPSAPSSPVQPSSKEEQGSDPWSWNDWPLPLPSYFFSESEEQQDPSEAKKLWSIRKGMTYVELVELLGVKGEKAEERFTYSWILENGDRLLVTFSIPTDVFKYSEPDDYLVDSLKIDPADESAPLRRSIYISSGERIEKIRVMLYETCLSSASEVADKVLDTFDPSTTDFWFKDLIPTDQNIKKYHPLEGFFLEGYYFYDVVEGKDDVAYEASLKKLLHEVLTRFDEQVASDLLRAHQSYMAHYYPDHKPLSSMKELLTLASLIEGDGCFDSSQYALLSATYQNRLNAGDYEGINGRICSPASLVYAVRAEQGEETSAGHLGEYVNTDSPYNTFVKNGLPPAPICTFSLEALSAAAFPAPDCPYYYYSVVIYDRRFFTSEDFFAKTAEEYALDAEKTGWTIPPEPNK